VPVIVARPVPAPAPRPAAPTPQPAGSAPAPAAAASLLVATRPVATRTATVAWNTPRPRASSQRPAEPAPKAKPTPRAKASAPEPKSAELSGNPYRLPLGERPSNGPSPLQADEALTGGRGILLVEDDATIAGMYSMLLATRGYSTRHAQDGVEGIAMVREERPALILLDMMMPRMDGLQFLEALRGWPKTCDIPVVILSNVGDRHLVEKAIALGAVEYLVKAQTRPQVLIGALPHWLRGNRALTTLS
jgi:CheY-like chemotaxis protein